MYVSLDANLWLMVPRLFPGLYGFLIAYIAAPAAVIHFDSAQIVELVHGLPEWFKYTAKGIIALPFTFHSINGLRHLAWDLGKCKYLPLEILQFSLA